MLSFLQQHRRPSAALLLLLAVAGSLVTPIEAQTGCDSWCHWDRSNCANKPACGKCESCNGGEVWRDVPGGGKCESWCHWDVLNCENKAACGACNLCNEPGVDAKIAAAKEAKKEPSWKDPAAGIGMCDDWCSKEYPATHCRFRGCKGCGFCVPGSPEAKALLQSKKVAPTVDDDLQCYVYRHPDLLQGFCKGVLEHCTWDALRKHRETRAHAEGRVKTCAAPDVKCYAYRYHDVYASFCKGQFSLCEPKKLLHHYATAGHKEGRTLACKAPDTECYVTQHPEVSSAFCKSPKGNSEERCNWEGILEHWATSAKAKGQKHNFPGCNTDVEKEVAGVYGVGRSV